MSNKDIFLTEVLDELTTDYETFDDYKRGVSQGKNVFVYSQVNPAAIANICRNGASGSKEYLDLMLYGRGIYTVLAYSDCRSYVWADAMVKYAVKSGALDNFLIFDKGIKTYLLKQGGLTKDEKISQTIRRLFSEEEFRTFERHYGRNLYQLDEEVEKCFYSGYSNRLEKDFIDIIRNSEGTINLYPGKSYHSERRLDLSKVDGFGYFGGYGRTLVFRTTDILIPYAYTIKYKNNNPGKDGWPVSERDFNYCIKDSETFENMNVSIDAFRRARKDYPDTSFTEKTVCGFSLVKRGNKFNLLNARTGKYFSPVDFDYCEAFDPISQTVTFSVDMDKNISIEFKMTSEGRGKNVMLLFNIIKDGEDDGQWTELDYDDFIAIMREHKNDLERQKRGRINENANNEVYTHKNYNAFQQYLNDQSKNHVILYHVSSAAQNIYENGPTSEYSGTNPKDFSLYYGLGVYTCRDFESCRFGGKYGNGCVKFILKDGYKDFLIFDTALRRIWDPGSTVYDELQRLVPQDILQHIDKYIRYGGKLDYLKNPKILSYVNSKGLDAYKMTDISPQGREFNNASFARALKCATEGGSLGDPIAVKVCDELLMARTKIRGFVFTGGEDGHVVFVRDFSGLMPIAYSLDRGKTWLGDMDEKHFNKINQRVDPFYQYRGEYEGTDLRAKSICGFSLVSGKKGYNYKDIWFHRPLLPIDVDKAFPFNPMTYRAIFNLCGIDFEIETDEDLNITLYYNSGDDGIVECDYDTFMEFVKEQISEGYIKNRQIYNNALLNPNNQRNK